MAERGRLHENIREKSGQHIKTICIVGSSHARNLTKTIRKSKLYENYIIDDMTLPGARMSKIAKNWPHEKIAKMSSEDCLILMALGNDMFEEGSHIITKNPKMIHLKHFSKENAESALVEFTKACTQLVDLVKDLVPKVYIFNNTFRYICGCPQHQYQGFIAYQAQTNRILDELISPVARVLRVDRLIADKYSHRNYSIQEQSSWLVDNVHLHPHLYRRLADNLLSVITSN